MKAVISGLILMLLCSCAGVIVTPDPRPGIQVDAANTEAQLTREGVSLKVRLAEASVRPSPVEKNICSFWVEIENQRGVLLPVSFTDFQLIADDGTLFQAENPEDLVALLKPQIPLLIPYPYVGYYYLNDSVRGQWDDAFRSELSFSSSRRPELIHSDALPEQTLQPQTKASGMIYFPAELWSMQGFEIRYQVGALAGQKSFPVSIPFSVEKN